MKELIGYLMTTKNKTGLVSLLLAITVYLNSIQVLFTGSVVLGVMNAIAIAVVLFAKYFAPTGNLEKGWKLTFYILNGLLFLNELATLLGNSGFINSEQTAKLAIIINGAIAAYQAFQSSKQTTV